MLPELNEIKRKRRLFDFTQTELAHKTGISQSLIAKIEAGSITPSYANAKRIFDFFESLHEGASLRAIDIMTKKVIFMKADSNVKEAIRTMERHSVSQIPVMDDDRNVGTISEKAVLDSMNKMDKDKVLGMKVSEIMEEQMPQVNPDTLFELVSAIMKQHQGALVAEKGKVIGIITKSDLLRAVAGGASGAGGVGGAGRK